MKRQVVRALTTFGLLTVMAMFLAVGSAQAQSLANTIHANIPFDFTVGGKKLPAGDYKVGRALPGSADVVLAIASSDGHTVTITNAVQTLNPAQATTLIFHRYGDQYFLSQVWVAGSNTGRAIPKSREERELERQVQGLAKDNRTKAVETVCIVAGLD